MAGCAYSGCAYTCICGIWRIEAIMLFMFCTICWLIAMPMPNSTSLSMEKKFSLVTCMIIPPMPY